MTIACVISVFYVSSALAWFVDLLSPFLDDNDLKGLELFARNILPGWTSWGNEVKCIESTIFQLIFFSSGFKVSGKKLINFCMAMNNYYVGSATKAKVGLVLRLHRKIAEEDSYAATIILQL